MSETNPIPVIRTRLGAWAWKWLPHDEKKRAALIGACAFVVGMIGPQLLGFPITGTMMSLQERAAWPMLVQQIEWTRSVAATIPCDNRVLAFAPIIAAVTELDRRIAHEHEAQQHWYSRYFSRRAWLTVKLIPLPCEQLEAKR